MSTVAARRRGTSVAEPKLRTIGAICDELREEFPDISVSKIRYLEDQGLIAPRRTRGGYRLFSPEDVERLVTILRLQRDEFLPLRVIRQELDGPGARLRSLAPPQYRPHGARGGNRCLRALRARFRVARVPAPARGVRRGRLAGRGWRPPYRESEADIAAASARLARFGIDARHLRTILTAAGRQAALVEQLVAPGMRSRNPERRKAAFEDLEALSGVAQELSHLLFLRDLRGTAERAGA